mgnify:CR=1 FL=1
MGCVGIVCAYALLSESRIHQGGVQIALHKCSQVLTYLRSREEVNCLCLLCDFNNQLSSDIANITGDYTWKMPDQKNEDREFAFLSLLQEFRLKAANAFSDCDIRKGDERSFTRRDWRSYESEIEVCSQIDYVCVSSGFDVQFKIVHEKVLQSDHCPVLGFFSNEVMLPRAIFRDTCAGYKFIDEREEENYVSSILDKLGLNGSHDDLENIGPNSLNDLFRVIQECAKQAHHTKKSESDRGVQALCPELSEIRITLKKWTSHAREKA